MHPLDKGACVFLFVVALLVLFRCLRLPLNGIPLMWQPSSAGRWKNESCTEHYEFREEFELTLPVAANWVSAAWFIDDSKRLVFRVCGVSRTVQYGG
jgi:hypothetical protein